MNDKRFTHDGVALETRIEGGGSLPVVLLHGLSGTMSTYDEVVRAIGNDVRVHRIDLRGHGRSARAPGTYTVPHYAADVVAYIEHVVGGPTVLVGHSLGGVITHHIAATRPDLVRAALCEDPPLYFCDQSLFNQSIFATVFPILEREMRRMQEPGITRADVRGFVANSPSPAGGVAANHQTAEAIDSRVDAMMHSDPDVWGPAIHGGALSGYDPNARIVCPLTILQADPAMGPALFPDHAERQRKANPDADVAFIKGAPHGIHDFIPSTGRYLGYLRDLIAAARS
jgi:pimeloyl-ACP methyl ester carboxylesterase